MTDETPKALTPKQLEMMRMMIRATGGDGSPLNDEGVLALLATIAARDTRIAELELAVVQQNRFRFEEWGRAEAAQAALKVAKGALTYLARTCSTDECAGWCAYCGRCTYCVSSKALVEIKRIEGEA